MSFKRIICCCGFFVFLLLSISGCNRQNSNVFQGYVEGRYAYISSSLGGRLEQLNIKRGDMVTQNTLLYKLDSQPEQSQLKQAQNKLVESRQTLLDMLKGKRPEFIAALLAQRAQVQTQQELDAKNLKRYQDLYKKRVLDKARLDAAVAAHKSDTKKIKEIDAKLAEAKLGARTNQVMAQQAAVNAANAAVKEAEWSLQQKSVTAPMAGQIFDAYYRQGEFVPAGHPVVSLLAPGNVKLVFFVAETTLSRIHVGDKLSFGCDSCSKTMQATISYISSQAEYTPPVIYSVSAREKLVYRVEARLMPKVAAKLHVGQPVDVTI